MKKGRECEKLLSIYISENKKLIEIKTLYEQQRVLMEERDSVYLEYIQKLVAADSEKNKTIKALRRENFITKIIAGIIVVLSII